MDAKAASLPLVPPHLLYNVCFILMRLKHLMNTFLHFHEMTSLAVLNNCSSFEN